MMYKLLYCVYTSIIILHIVNFDIYSLIRIKTAIYYPPFIITYVFIIELLTNIQSAPRP